MDLNTTAGEFLWVPGGHRQKEFTEVQVDFSPQEKFLVL